MNTNIVIYNPAKLKILLSADELKALLKILETAEWGLLIEPYRSVSMEPAQKLYLRLLRRQMGLLPGKKVKLSLSRCDAAALILILRVSNMWIHRSDIYSLALSNKIVSTINQYLA